MPTDVGVTDVLAADILSQLLRDTPVALAVPVTYLVPISAANAGTHGGGTII